MESEPTGARSRLDRRSLARALPVAIASLLAAWFLSACTSTGSSEAPPSPTPEVVASPEAAQTVATPRAPARPPPPRLGVWIVDAVSGEITKLYELNEELQRPFSPPSITATGAVWLTGADGIALRYLPDGTVTETIEGAVVWESGDSTARALLELDGGRLSLEGGGQRTVVSDAALMPVLSPDGRTVAYLEQRGEAEFDLLVATVEGEPTILVTDLQFCQCGEPPGPAWSPSAEFIAVGDFGRLGSEDADDRGGYVVRADGDSPPVRVAERPRELLGWLALEDSTLVLQVISEPRLYDARTGTSRSLLLPGQIARGTGRLSHDGRQVQIWTPDGGTTLVDPSVGEEVERWSLRGDAALTPFGPALTLNGPAINTVSIPGCWGVWIEHPNLPEGECVRGAERAQWSPDGLTLALLSDVRPFDRWLEFWTFGDEMVRVLVPRSVTQVEWSADGRHVLVAWGYGE